MTSKNLPLSGTVPSSGGQPHVVKIPNSQVNNDEYINIFLSELNIMLLTHQYLNLVSFACFLDFYCCQPRVETKPEVSSATIRPRDQRIRDRPSVTSRGPRSGMNIEWNNVWKTMFPYNLVIFILGLK